MFGLYLRPMTSVRIIKVYYAKKQKRGKRKNDAVAVDVAGHDHHQCLIRRGGGLPPPASNPGFARREDGATCTRCFTLDEQGMEIQGHRHTDSGCLKLR